LEAKNIASFLEILVVMKYLFCVMCIFTSIAANAGLGEVWRDDRSGTSGIGALILVVIFIRIWFSKRK
jgi:hypothetical protein